MLKNLPCFSTKAFHCCAILLFALNISAQDTIIVQTLTLDSDLRAGVFTFPDDPTQTYEKILMIYQMRCHDAAVGNGSVGCREWDYSCNTFITDSTRVDSNLAIHPNYVISNFSGSEFSYTQQPVYDYTQYEQSQVVYNNVVTETTALVGTGDLPMALGGPQTEARMQVLYSATELTDAGLTAGPISSLRMDVSSLGSDINFMRIKMKHSSKTELESTDPDFSDFTEVYFLSTNFQNTGEYPFLFHNDFEWDGTSNILVEFSFTNQDPGGPVVFNSHEPGFSSTILSSNGDRALAFAGSGFVELDGAPLASVNNELTVAFWANGNGDILPANVTAFEGQDAAGNRQANVHLPWSNGQVYWDCGANGAAYDRINAVANAADFEDQWSHWAFTKNAATGNMTIYLNGEVFLNGTGKTNPIELTSFIFAQNFSGNNNYYGTLDDLQIWDVALDQATIQEWMRQTITIDHPNYSNLLAYFPLNEGSGSDLVDQSSNSTNATVVGAPGWERIRGKDLFKDFVTTSLRPNVTFVQGTYDQTTTTVFVLDSVLSAQNQITAYEVVGTDLVESSTFLVYPAGAQNILNEQGEIVGTVMVDAENTITVSDLSYYNKFPSKYEILSLVTPYGNGLNLGQNGKTFTFDVTDYAPILKGDRRMSIEMGGQNQEELDIRFLYITGTPPREVKEIQNIWPFRRGVFSSILSDAVFEPREVPLAADGSSFEIRSSITGHGQNGEFVERSHYLDVNGGVDEFVFSVWKECGGVPIYPQGGTWLFDRAGWCPGDPTTVNRFDITPHVTAGSTAEIDYGLIGNNMESANYLVSNQLVTYGAPNFEFDAAITDVIRPSRKVEHERFNPACNLPTVVIQNTGSANLTALEITYQVEGGTPLTYSWTGNLAFLETETVELPVDDLSFWETDDIVKYFVATINTPTGGTDEYVNNNSIRSNFLTATVLPTELVLNYKTNNRGEENKMYLRDYAGNVLLERTFMDDDTEYTDEFDLPGGCYSLEFTDTGGDGLDYWFWNQTNPSIGTGYLRLRRVLPSGNLTTVKTFEPEFGSFVRFDFILPEIVSTVEAGEKPTLLSVYPNPTADVVNVDLVGFENSDVVVSLFNSTGQRITTESVTNNLQHQLLVSFDVSQLPSGVYQVQVSNGKKTNYAQVVVE